MPARLSNGHARLCASFTCGHTFNRPLTSAHTSSRPTSPLQSSSPPPPETPTSSPAPSGHPSPASTPTVHSLPPTPHYHPSPPLHRVLLQLLNRTCDRERHRGDAYHKALQNERKCHETTRSSYGAKLNTVHGERDFLRKKCLALGISLPPSSSFGNGHVHHHSARGGNHYHNTSNSSQQAASNPNHNTTNPPHTYRTPASSCSPQTHLYTPSGRPTSLPTYPIPRNPQHRTPPIPPLQRKYSPRHIHSTSPADTLRPSYAPSGPHMRPIAPQPGPLGPSPLLHHPVPRALPFPPTENPGPISPLPDFPTEMIPSLTFAGSISSPILATPPQPPQTQQLLHAHSTHGISQAPRSPRPASDPGPTCLPSESSLSISNSSHSMQTNTHNSSHTNTHNNRLSPTPLIHPSYPRTALPPPPGLTRTPRPYPPPFTLPSTCYASTSPTLSPSMPSASRSSPPPLYLPSPIEPPTDSAGPPPTPTLLLPSMSWTIDGFSFCTPSHE